MALLISWLLFAEKRPALPLKPKSLQRRHSVLSPEIDVYPAQIAQTSIVGIPRVAGESRP